MFGPISRYRRLGTLKLSQVWVPCSRSKFGVWTTKSHHYLAKISLNMIFNNLPSIHSFNIYATSLKKYSTFDKTEAFPLIVCNLHTGEQIQPQRRYSSVWNGWVLKYLLAELQNLALNPMCSGRAGVNNWFPDHKSDTFWDIVMKLHTLTPNESRMHPIDFGIKRSKVKVMEHGYL